MRTPIAAVYEIHHMPSAASYIGSTNNVGKRWNKHLRNLVRGIHHCKPLQGLYNEDGAASITFRVLEVVTDRSQLREREQYWMNGYPFRINPRNAVTDKVSEKIERDSIDGILSPNPDQGWW